jgi:hemerythrin-like domain-containing protein
MTDELALASRTGLPDPLRLLVEKYPRPEWEGHPHFTALTRFWLDMHLGFRRMQSVLLAETRGFLDRDREPRAFARGLVGVAGQFLDGLHGHHNIEDHHYFPILKTLDARIGWGFELLDADHQAMDGAIDELARSANAVLRAIRDDAPADVAAGALLTHLGAFERMLDRHLTDEEELVVPVILDHPEAGLG